MNRFLSLTPCLALVTALTAQLPLATRMSFSDPNSGGSGNIGVTQDEVSMDYYVLDLSNVQAVHTFDQLGTAGPMYATTGCTPSSATPDDVVYDPFTRSLWLVDNAGVLLQMDLAGNCMSGTTLTGAPANPAGITVHRATGSLWISGDGALREFDRAGSALAGSVTFVPPSGSNSLSGVTYMPASDGFLVVQSGGSTIFHIDASGALLSSTSLARFGITDTQGLHYNPVLQQLAVVDAAASMTHVFNLSLCSGSTVHEGVGCVDGGGTTLALSVTGCPDLGESFTLETITSADAMPIALFIGISNTRMPCGTPLPLNLAVIGADPNCVLYSSGEFSTQMATAGGRGQFPLSIPPVSAFSGTTLYWQAVKPDARLNVPFPIAVSNSVAISVR